MAATLPQIAVLTAPDEPAPPGLEPLAGRAEVSLARGRAELEQLLPEADALLVTDFRTTAVRDAWPAARKLRWVHASSAGVDALMFPELVASDVVVTNARGIFDRAIAEYVLGLVLMDAKDFRGTLALQHERRWKHRETERIDGRRMLVVGAGSIGRTIARLARAAGMRVAGVARTARSDDADFETVHAHGSLDAALPEADWVVVAAPLTAETRGLFGAARLARMKPTARLVNIGRGPIVDTDALVDALRSGTIAGAALDVFEQEPLPADHPLWSLRQVVVSPHMAGDFVGWREALGAQFCDFFARWTADEPLPNVVDKDRHATAGASAAATAR